MSQHAANPHPIDIHVGARIRQRRLLRGVTQNRLAKALGITFQQIQKYESGANRTSASRLWQIAKLFEVPVSFFFDGLRSSGPKGEATAPAEPAAPALRALGKAFAAIEDPVLRVMVADFAKRLAAIDAEMRAVPAQAAE